MISLDKSKSVSGCYAALLVAAMLAACASGPAANPQDPYESTNRRISEFNEKVDTNLARPVAVGQNGGEIPLADGSPGEFDLNLDLDVPAFLRRSEG